jgi:hypothetical protein
VWCAAAIVVLAGCGGAATTPFLGPTAGVSTYSAGTTTHGARALAGPARDVVHRSGTVAVGHGHDAEPGGEPHAVSPCALVTPQEIAAIIRQPVNKAVEGSIGPTCVYIPRGAPIPSRRHAIEVTLAVTQSSFNASAARLENRIFFKVFGHRAYCGLLGRPMALVSLSRGRVMAITAPCPLAAAIAKAAVPRLTGY